MTVTTTNTTLTVADGWTLVADSPKYLALSPSSAHPYFIGFGASAPAGDTVATGTIVFSDTGTDADTVTVDGQVYTLKTSLTAPTTADEVLIGVDAATTAANLSAAINKGAGGGTTYGSDTVANTSVTATVSTVTITVTAIAANVGGNTVTLTEDSTHVTVSGAVLSGGAYEIKGISVASIQPFVIPLAIVGKVWVRVRSDTGTPFILSAAVYT